MQIIAVADSILFIYTFIHRNGSIKKKERKTKVKTRLLIGAAMHKALCYNGNHNDENNTAQKQLIAQLLYKIYICCTLGPLPWDNL
jgi:hypothetical protein